MAHQITGDNGKHRKVGWRFMEFEFLDQLKEKWEPVSTPALVGWLA
jgi:hypothetical protein